LDVQVSTFRTKGVFSGCYLLGQSTCFIDKSAFIIRGLLLIAINLSEFTANDGEFRYRLIT
jgi:hypothetical protein